MAIAQLVQCPETKTALRLATHAELAILRQRQESGGLLNRLGRRVTVPLEEGFVSDATRCFYCRVQGVIWLLAEEAIPLDCE